MATGQQQQYGVAAHAVAAIAAVAVAAVDVATVAVAAGIAAIIGIIVILGVIVIVVAEVTLFLDGGPRGCDVATTKQSTQPQPKEALLTNAAQ